MIPQRPRTATAVVGGRVRDKISGHALEGVVVKLGETEGAFADETVTRSNGLFHFVKVPLGRYALTAAMPGAGTRRSPAKTELIVEAEEESKPARVFVDVLLGTTAVRGFVGNANGPVVMAQVRVKGSGERTFTDREGRYRIDGLEAGRRTVQVTAPGFKKSSKPVTLSGAGVEHTLDFKLARE